MLRPRAALLALGAAVAAPVALALPSGPAAADLPTRGTTYRDASIDAADHSGSLTIRVGANPRRIARIVIVADCDGEKERFARRNIPIRDDGRFSVSGGRYVSVEGRFRTEHWATGSLTTHQCGFFGGDCSARD